MSPDTPDEPLVLVAAADPLLVGPAVDPPAEPEDPVLAEAALEQCKIAR
jgi:hypothetical protein